MAGLARTLARSIAKKMANPVTLSPGGGQASSPVTILGAALVAWWTADRADLLTLSGSQVVSWRDVVTGLNAPQAVAGSRGLYGATSFNGAPSIALDGIDDCFDFTPTGFPSGATPGEIWIVGQQDALATDVTVRRALAYGDTNAVSRYLAYSGNGTSVFNANLLVGDGAAIAVSVAGGLTGRHVVRGKTDTNVTASVDGAAGTVNPVTPATVLTRGRIGASAAASASGFWSGKLRDIVITTALTTQQAADLDAWAEPRRMP